MDKIIAKLQTPVDSSGVRKEVHLITSPDAVIIDGTTTLGDIINNFGVGLTITRTKPAYACIWAYPLAVEAGDGIFLFQEAELKPDMALIDGDALNIFIQEDQPDRPCIWCKTLSPGTAEEVENIEIWTEQAS